MSEGAVDISNEEVVSHEDMDWDNIEETAPAMEVEDSDSDEPVEQVEDKSEDKGEDNGEGKGEGECEGEGKGEEYGEG